jgi:PAS domain S-box-containing protein
MRRHTFPIIEPWQPRKEYYIHGMRRFRQLFTSLVLDDAVALRIRLYRLMCATTCLLCLAVVLPMNWFQNLPIWVNVADVLLGLIAGYCFWESRRGREFFFGFFAVLLVLLNLVWFFNAGSEGSIAYYFFPLILYPIAIFSGRMRLGLTALVMANVCGLFVFEYFVPALTVPFKHPSDRVIDLATGAFCSCLAVAIIARLILANYDKEHLRLSQSAEKLAAGEQNYREIFNATSDALVVQDARGRVIDVNDRLCALFGYDRATVVRLTVDDLSSGVSPYSRYEAAKKVKLALTHGPQTFPWRCKRAGGELFWAEVTLRAGEIVREKRVIVSVRDISERVRAEDELRVQEERLRLALDASRQGWFDVNVQTGEGRASAEYAKIIGREPVDFKVSVGEWMAGVHPEDREPLQNVFQECLATGQSRTMEYRRRMPAGDWKWIRSIAKIVEFDARGQARRMLGTHTDITERKDLEAKLLHSQRLESVATLAGGVAHDLNNILTPMLMAGGVLDGKLKDPADREMMRTLESGARRGATIVRQLMTFAQSMAEYRVTVDPAQVIRDAVQFARATFPPSIAVVDRLPPDLWPVTADPAQLQQVLQSLCTNAREAMPLGGTLTLSAENTQRVRRATTRNPWGKGGAFVVITVADTGRGIPPEIIGRIFDPFFTTKEIGQGSGLGLSSVHGIVNGHGGEVTVESQPGIGATFKVYLPAKRVTTTARAV